jgi:hypothetical protein
MIWKMLHPQMTEAHLGLLPNFLSNRNPLSAREQLDLNYAHGGGWLPMGGFKLTEQNRLIYPGDPPLIPRAQTQLRDELIILYDHSWVAIIQHDRSFEVCRMD